MNDWLPIDQAPKDGSIFAAVCMNDDVPEPRLARWKENHRYKDGWEYCGVPLDRCYYGCADEYDDYELAERGGPERLTHFKLLLPLPAKAREVLEGSDG